MKVLRFGLMLIVCLFVLMGQPAQAMDLFQQSEGSITYGETVDGRIRTSEGDSWTFEAEEGDIVTISLIGDSLFDPVLELFGPNGIRIAMDDDSGIRFDSLIQYQRLDQPGDYTIVATGFGGRTGSYSLTLESSGGSNAGQGASGFIGYGDTIEGRVTSDRGDFWNFFGEAGQVIQIDAIGQGLDDTVIELYGPGLELLMTDDDGGGGYNSRISGFELSESGTYLLVVRGYDGRTGTYQLTLDEFSLELESEGELVYGDTQLNEVTTAAGDRWVFEGSVGDTISIILSGEGLEDTYLELYGPNEMLLAQDDDSGPGLSSLIRAYTLVESGTYSIIARGYNNRVGSYSITLMGGEEGVIGGSSMQGELSFGETVSGEVSSVFGDSWSFSGVSGDIVSIDTVGDTLGDTYLELYAPDGALLTQDDDSGNGYSARIAGFRLPENGTYTIIVRGFDGASGSYELSLVEGRMSQNVEADYGDPTPQGELEFGQIVEGNIEAEDGDLWTFAAEAGTILTIQANGAGLEDTYLELYDPQGWLAAFDDDSGPGFSSMIDDYVLSQDGVYSLIVRGYGGGTGTYSLELLVTGTTDVDSGSSDGGDSVAAISNAACGDGNTYFTLTIDGQAAQTQLQHIVIEPYGPASIAQVFPVVGSQMNEVVGEALYDVVIDMGPIRVVSGQETLFDIGAMLLQVLDQQASVGVDAVDITYVGNEGDLKFIVWGSYLEGGGIEVSTYWGEQTDPSVTPGVPEGMSGELISVQDPCD